MTIYTAGSLAVLPGDFAAVHMHDDTSGLIHIGEILNGDGFRNYEHAITYLGGQEDLIIEAEPSGAKIVPMHYNIEDCLWSTGISRLSLTVSQAFRIDEIANTLKGTPYSWLDYWALAMHRLRIPAPGLRDYIGSTGHMICSQMVDTIRLMMRDHLFDDDRWPGYVTPVDLANLISGGAQMYRKVN